MGARSPWINSTYCWVVICNNVKVHRHANVMYGHRVPLGETDAFAPPPISGPFVVQCDDCGKEYSYEPEHVLRVELELPASFAPHPLFQ
jgi:hypothetical protein